MKSKTRRSGSAEKVACTCVHAARRHSSRSDRSLCRQEIEPKALKKESDRARTRMGAKIARSATRVDLVSPSVWAVRADERCQTCLGQHPMLHLPGDGNGAVRPHKPSQHRVEIGSPIVKGLAFAPKGTGKLGVA